MASWSDCVGKHYRHGEATYLCESYDMRYGFKMKLVEGVDGWFPERKLGHIAEVSERAIGRTYHEVRPRRRKS